jgi:glutamyl-tRNA synthetase
VSTAGVRGRYAPSPTGELHLGNLRTALLAWLCARSAGGALVLRIEDLDQPRTRPGSAAHIMSDLRWLGLNWDEGPDVGGPLGPYVQSARDALYAAALARLRDRGLLYPCYCTRAELARMASAPHGAGDEGSRYPGTCRDLSADERRARETAGQRPSLRLRVPDAIVRFEDAIAGAQEQGVARTVGDFVVRRSDGLVAYQLAVVVDDALMGITQVLRGADLLSSTARQLVLYDALGWRRPAQYVHVPLALGPDGTRLAKREAAEGLQMLRERGKRREDVLGALAASVGLWPAGEAAALDDLLGAFEVRRLDARPSSIRLA